MSSTEPKRRKRKATVSDDKDIDNKADRKRVQNRISQQCLREKQIARTRHLESVMDLVKSNASTTSSSHSNNAPAMEAHLKLITENEQLRDALFRMRKKLLSLSHMAATAAEDGIFEMLLGGGSNQNSSHTDERESASLSGSNTVVEDISATAVENNTTCASESAQQLAADSQSNDLSLESGDWSFPAFGDNPDQGLTSCINNLDSSFMFGPLDTTIFDGVNGCFNGMGDLVRSHTELPISSFTQSFPHLTLSPPRTILINNRPTTLTDKIIKACSRYRQAVSLTSHGHDHGYSLGNADPAVRDTTKTLAMTAVQLMCNFAGLQPYIYGVSAATAMESILRWRLTNSTEDRLAIPEPFRPTPLQYSRADHSAVIDMVNWPSIRDQLIIKSMSIDLDSIINDVVLHTVIEDPSRKVCMNVYDVFYNKVWPLYASSELEYQVGGCHDSRDRISAVDASPSTIDATAESTETDLFREISLRMKHGSHGYDGSQWPLSQQDLSSSVTTDISFPKTPYIPGTRHNIATQQLNNSSALYGLNEMSSWKLSGAFARKYPFLDCSQVVAKYEMVPCSRIIGF